MYMKSGVLFTLAIFKSEVRSLFVSPLFLFFFSPYFFSFVSSFLCQLENSKANPQFMKDTLEFIKKYSDSLVRSKDSEKRDKCRYVAAIGYLIVFHSSVFLFFFFQLLLLLLSFLLQLQVLFVDRTAFLNPAKGCHQEGRQGGPPNAQRLSKPNQQ